MSEPSTQLERNSWPDAQRLESWAGELRVNMIRLLALLLFYGRHLIEYWLAAPDAPVRGAYHTRITWLCMFWAGAAIVLHVRLLRRQVTPTLKYVAVLIDAVMITLLCMLAGGPKSPLILLYFLLIASASLRLSLHVVYLATACAIGGYLIMLANYAWREIGYARYYATPELRIPRSHEAIVVVALLVAGLFAGQMVRQARRLSERYAVTLDDGKD